MRPTPDQVRAGVAALHRATEHRSVKRDPAAAVAAVYEAMTADAVMPPPALVFEAGPLNLDSLGGIVKPPIAPGKPRKRAKARA